MTIKKSVECNENCTLPSEIFTSSNETAESDNEKSISCIRKCVLRNEEHS